ncbi:MAG: DNA polymerase I [Proteobacteria bacterium]|jgi:DNA polymerase-1|nr:DNA polymerase I [Alphaproteobacteria bacterium]NCC03570.1 DNA polymerase I [Pseudomonadota bacterium]
MTKKTDLTADDKILYLIDGSGYIFRAYHALPPMTRRDGTPINAVYGFCAMLQKLLMDLGAYHIAVIFDAARKTFRNEIYSDYKAHRPEPPEDLIPQFPLIRQATKAFGIPALELPNYEADDLIAAYAREGVEQGFNVRVVSADKDLMQLVRPRVELYDPMKNIPIGEAEVLAKFGVTPDKVVDVQALAGDSSDNVPGVPGIGIKTAAELINEYGSLETLLDRASEIKQPKRREKLIENAELARISKQLVTLDDHAPLPAAIETLVRRANHNEELLAFLQEQEFKSLLTRFQKNGEIPAETPKLPSMKPVAETTRQPTIIENTPQLDDTIACAYELIQDAQALQRWVTAALDQGYVAIDTETDSLTPSRAKLIGASLALTPGKACYIPLGHIDPDTAPADDGGFVFAAPKAPPQMKLSDFISILKPLLADPSVIKIAHNMKYDWQVLAQHGLSIANYDDTMLMSYVLGAGAHGHGLDELAERHFQHKMIAYDEVTKVGRQRITFDRVPLEQALAYAAEDADFTLRLWLTLKPQLVREHLMHVYERIERPLVSVVAAMEQKGVLVDPVVLRTQSQNLAVRLQKREEEIYKLAGHSFNVASPKQLAEVLFNEMGLPTSAKGKSGAPSTSVDVLEPLAEQGHEIVAKVLDWRGLSKLKSTYTDALPEQINPKTGRIHTSFSLIGAATGRLSSTDPNLQNIPIRTEEGRAIRQAFIAKEGCELLSVDYSQIELRLAAEAAGISALIGAFAEGDDIHALTASQVFNIPMKDMTPEKRRLAKAINFGIIYGISGFGLAKQLGCTPGEANQFITAYLDRFHELRDWMEATKTFARAHGYVETLFGRRIHIQGINDKNHARRSGAERQAINAPLQGTAADIMKRAMIRIPPALHDNKLSADLLLQVHDELIFEVPLNELEATATLVRSIMEAAPKPVLTLRVPLIAEAGHAPNWAKAH